MDDVDDDGDSDVVLNTVWYEQDGDAWIAHAMSPNTDSVADYFIDLDDDRNRDLLEFADRSIRYELYRAELGVYQPFVLDTVGTVQRYVRDIDDDQDLDIVIVINQGSRPFPAGSVFWYQNRGDGTFDVAERIDRQWGIEQIDVADFNGDGLADVLTALGSRNAIAIAWNTDPGAGSETRAQQAGGPSIGDHLTCPQSCTVPTTPWPDFTDWTKAQIDRIYGNRSCTETSPR